MAKKSIYLGFKDAEDYFTNASDQILQKHYRSIEDFETSMLFMKALWQYRNVVPLLTPNHKILKSMGLLKVGE
jgi:hypothetical protein